MEKIKPREVSKEAAKQFLISRQGFLQAQKGKKGTLEAVKRLECIQTDPIKVVQRNQHLVLHSRIVITSLLTWMSCFTRTGLCSNIGAMKNL